MYLPRFKGPIEGWTVNYTHSQFWRVESMMEWADVMQEAYIVFMRVSAKYPTTDTPQHFMALYKRAWANHITDLSNEATQLRRLVSSSHADDDDVRGLPEPIGEIDNDGLLGRKLAQAPEEVRKVLTLMLTAPQEILDVLLADWRGQDARRRDGGGAKINAALGLPKGTDVYKVVHDYLCR